jgi:hypothetical protein
VVRKLFAMLFQAFRLSEDKKEDFVFNCKKETELWSPTSNILLIKWIK